MPLKFSLVDSDYFGFPIARFEDETLADLAKNLGQARKEGVRLAFLRCKASDLALIQQLQRAHFFLTDTTLTYTHRLDSLRRSESVAGVVVREFQEGDEAALITAARAAFCDYAGHYQTDDRLDPKLTANLYVRRVESFCARRNGTKIFIAERGTAVQSFLISEPKPGGVWEGTLGGAIPMSPKLRHKAYELVLGAAFHDASRQSTPRSYLGSTQLHNRSVLKILMKWACEFSHAEHTFHKWFD